MKLPQGVKRGEFELAHSLRGYLRTKAYLSGPLAVHRDESGHYWRISHAGTGFYLTWANTLTDALALSRRLAKAIDWSRVKRRPLPKQPIGASAAVGSKLLAVVAKFRERH